MIDCLIKRAALAALAAVIAAAPAGAQSQPPVYVVPPPAGKLPFPQHDPSFTQVQYDSMYKALFMLGNFGMYQSGMQPGSTYLHDGFDDMMPNGTKVFAVAAGTVRFIDQRNEYYKVIIIEDEAKPNHAWSYAHVDSFQVKVGDQVHQGTYIAKVRFRGLEHTHLDRVYKPEGGAWDNWYSLPHLNFYPYFDLRDTEPPVFEDAPIRYFRNQSDSAFTREVAGNITLSGDVDIVVGMREQAPFARTATGGMREFGDRLAVGRIEYEIKPAKGKGKPEVRPSFDLLNAEIKPGNRTTPPTNNDVALTLYKFYPLMQPDSAKPWWRTRVSYYVVTNSPEAGPARRIDPAHAANAWKTAEKLPNGKPRYPNGDYALTVRVWDAAGNLATKTDTVTVRNQP